MFPLHRLSVACLAALAAWFAADARAAVVAGPIWNPATGHEYYLLSANTWSGAEAEAVGLGGNLVAILDQAENAWVWETFAPIQGGPLWIGLNDVEQEGTFVWTSGRLTDYTNWWVGGGQPSGDGDAVEMNNYVWNDNDGNAVFAAVAEVVPPGPVRIQVAWSATVNGAVGLGTLSGSLGEYEVADEGLVFPLPAGAALTATADGFLDGFPNQDYALDMTVGGLAIRFDGLDPIATTFVSTEAASYAARYSSTTPCSPFQCRVVFERYVDGGFGFAHASQFDGGLETWSEGTPVFTYTVVPEPGDGAAWAAAAALLALARRSARATARRGGAGPRASAGESTYAPRRSEVRP